MKLKLFIVVVLFINIFAVNPGKAQKFKSIASDGKTLLGCTTDNKIGFISENGSKFTEIITPKNYGEWHKNMAINEKMIVLLKDHYICVSSDMGLTWNENKTDFDFWVYDIAISGTDIYIAFLKGLYVSKNFGKSWKIVSGTKKVRINSLLKDGNSIYAGGKNRGSDFPFYISDDNGLKWREVMRPANLRHIYTMVPTESGLILGGYTQKGNGAEIFMFQKESQNWEKQKFINDTTQGDINQILIIDKTVFFRNYTTSIGSVLYKFTIGSNTYSTAMNGIDKENGYYPVLNVKMIDSMLYALTFSGIIYLSDNNGESWKISQLHKEIKEKEAQLEAEKKEKEKQKEIGTEKYQTLETYAKFKNEKNINTNPEIIVQKGHPSTVQSVCFSPDGKYILSGCLNVIRLWEISTGKEVRRFTGHSTGITSINFSPNSNFFLSSCGDKTIKLWDINTGKDVMTFIGHTSGVSSACFSPDGKYILSGGSWNDNTLKLWDVSTGKEIKTFTGHTERVTSVCYTPDGNFALSGSVDATIKLWDISTGKEISSYLQHQGEVRSVCFSPDGKYFISGGEDKTIRLWDFSKGKVVKTFYENSWISNICFSPDGKYIICDADIELIHIWDVSTGNIHRTFVGHKKFTACVNFSQDSKYAASGSADNSLKIWDVSSGNELKIFPIQAEPIKSVLISPQHNFAMAESGSKVKLIDITKGNIIKEIGGLTPAMFSPPLSLSPDGKTAIKWLELMDIETSKFLRKFPVHYEEINTVSFSPDGKFVLTGGSHDNLRLIEASTGKEIKEIIGHYGTIYAACFTPDGKYALSTTFDNTLRLWDIQSAREVRKFNGNTGFAKVVKISKDGKYVLTGNVSDTIQLWDFASGNELKIFSTNVKNNSIFTLCFSPDGKYILSGSADKTVKLWEISTGKLVRTLVGHELNINAAEFSEDGKYIYSASWDQTIKQWDTESGALIATITTFNNDWLIFTPDMYFDCSNEGGEAVAMAFQNHGYNIDQIALKYNRPDIVLQRIGCKDNILIQHYYNQYKKRLRKNGFTEEQLSSEIQVPSASISNIKQDGKFVSVKFNFNDEKYNLKRYNVYVNDVPLYGSFGKSLSSKYIDLTEKIELTSGENKIEVSCMNEKGVESYRALTYASFNMPVNKDLYILAFGVSKYQNPDYNLAYADKDALDISKVIETYKGKGFENVYTKILTNEQVTPESIKASKDFLKDAKPDDTFILFIAGHGMHDNDPEATYYYLTSNADVNNLKNTAADFETIEDLLQGIPPRNKLFLMDACESGEIDDDDQGQMLAVATGEGIASRGFKSVSPIISSNVKQPETKRSYLYQKNRYIYNDLVRRSGAIVFSSSKGGELSYERSDIENGLFTEYIMKALTSSEADADKNGIISTDELRNYVSEQVAKASNGLQHPTVDRDNIYQKFGFRVK